MVFLGHIVGLTGLACDAAKLIAIRNWHAPDKDFAELAEPLVALTRNGVPFVWTDQQQTAFEALKACLVCAPILGFTTEDGRFVLDMDASLFAVGGVLSQLQKKEKWSLHMPAVVYGCPSVDIALLGGKC